jgi:hypothetical protein
MDKEYLNILIVGHPTLGTRNLKIKKETFKILIYLLAFLQLSLTFFLCDYIQVKKKNFFLNQLRQESHFQKSQIQLFSTKIEELEKQLIKLRDLDRKIHIIANLEKDHESTSFIGLGGFSSSANQGRLSEEPKGSE